MNDRANVAASDSTHLDAVGGVDALGCGINKVCWPGGLDRLNRVLDAKHNEKPKVIDGKTYQLGENVEYWPNTDTISQIDTFESVAEYDKKSSVSLNAKGKYGAFSAGFESTFSQRTSTLDEYYAGVRHETQQLWTLQMKNLESNLHEKFIEEIKTLPTEFKKDRSTINAFVDFFKSYGTDVITEVTVGGSVSYSAMIKKSSSSKKSDLDASISVGYGAFVANASTSISEEQKNQAKTQKVSIRTWGGLKEDAIQFNVDQPMNCSAAVATWRKNLSQAPQVVDVKLKPIDELVPRKYKEQKDAVKKAREWYLGYEATIKANWQESSMSVDLAKAASDEKKTLAHQGEAPLRAQAGGEPALRIGIVGVDRTLREEVLQAPSRHADVSAFDAFWQRVTEKLAAVATNGHEMVLVATERWPRNERYYPSIDVRKLLRAHGASDDTLKRWKKLVRHMQPCNIAGVTYVLAGRAIDNKLSDFVVAGFGTNANTICPTVNAKARLIGEDASWSRVLVTEWSEATNTKLHMIRNIDGEKSALAAGTQLKTTIEMVTPGEKAIDGGTYLGQYWYFLRFPRYHETPNSHFIINYETGACLQSMIEAKADCQLQAFGDEDGPRQDDIIWDIRGTASATNFLVLHCWHDAFNLTQRDKSATVKTWRQNFMIWSLEEFNNLHW